MAFANKIRVADRTIGWNVFFSHPEAEGIATGAVLIPTLLAGVTGPKVPAILQGLPHPAWNSACRAGGHHGVKAIVMFFPPHAVLVPR